MTGRYEVEEQPGGGYAVVDTSDGSVAGRAPKYRDAMDMARLLNQARGPAKSAPAPDCACCAETVRALLHYLDGRKRLLPALGYPDVAAEEARLIEEALAILRGGQTDAS